MSVPQAPARLPASAWAPLLREALDREGRFRWPLRGASMTPTLPRACDIEVARLPEQVAPGTLVVFVAGDTLIAHRLVRRAGGRWVTHGDGCLAPDPLVDLSQMLGVVTAAFRGDQQCWPSRSSRRLTWFWIARHHALRPAGFAWRWLRRRLAI